MRSLAAPTLALCLLALTACSGGDEPSEPGETVTVFSDPSSAATPDEEVDESTTVEPNVGDRALQVGQQRAGRLVTTTLLEVRDPYPPPDEYRLSGPDNKFIGLRVSQCGADDYGDLDAAEVISSFNSEWSAVTASGDEYPGSGSSYNDFPLPKFPETSTIPPGTCVKGWLALEVPSSVKPDKFVWRSEGATLAEWLL